MNPAPNNTDFEKFDIFTILGVAEDDPDREAFRAELEDAIWEEIMEKEVAEQLSDEDLDRVDAILADDSRNPEDQRNALFGLLAEKLPNMEEVVREYTVQAKSELLYQRLAGLKEFYQNDQSKLEQVQKAEELYDHGNLVETVHALNAITA